MKGRFCIIFGQSLGPRPRPVSRGGRSVLPDCQLGPRRDKLTSTTARALEPGSRSATAFNAKCNRVRAEVASANTVVCVEEGSMNIDEKVNRVVVGRG
jgi:hypothetical protein